MTITIDLPAILREFGADLRLRDSENMGPTRCELALASEVARLRAEIIESRRCETMAYQDCAMLEAKLAAAERQRDDLQRVLRGMLSIEDSVTQGQERERRAEWLPKARAALERQP